MELYQVVVRQGAEFKTRGAVDWLRKPRGTPPLVSGGKDLAMCTRAELTRPAAHTIDSTLGDIRTVERVWQFG